MRIPQYVAATYTLKGVWAALIAAVVVLLLAIVVIQTSRLQGFKVWPVNVEGALPKIDRLELEIAAIIQAQKDATQAQQQVNSAAETTYRDISGRIDHDTAQQIETELDVADRYVRANSLRGQASRCAPRRAATAPGHNSASSGEAAGSQAIVDDSDSYGDEGMVVVNATDVRVCTINTLQAEAGRRWALELEAASKDR